MIIEKSLVKIKICCLQLIISAELNPEIKFTRVRVQASTKVHCQVG